MNERAKQWNQFIGDICMRDYASLSDRQREAVICFWYDTEMQNGGHSAYFDSERLAASAETEAAIRTVGTDAIADNFRKAVEKGKSDDYAEADQIYYDSIPSMSTYLMQYVSLHADEILNR